MADAVVVRQAAAPPAEAAPMADAVDLAAGSDEQAWVSIAAAADRDPLARLAVAARAEARRLADVAVARITATIPSYATAQGVERSDLWWSAYRNLELILLVLGQRREPTPAELEVRAELGRRRADAGMDCADITRAFRVGYQHMWLALTRLARDDGVTASQALLDHASHVWGALDAVSSTVEHAHRARSLERDAAQHRAGTELIDSLHDYPFGRNQTAARARAAGLDPTGPLVVAVGCGTPVVSLPGAVVVALVDRTIVIAQPSRGLTDVAVSAVLQRDGMSHVGVGLVGDGLAGAHTSLRHAEMAHRSAMALDRSDVVFSRDWLECLVADAAPAMGPMLAPVVDVLRSSPDLTETVRAVVEADGCFETAARVLFVHPNTVAYRLRRLNQLTGIRPRTADGLLRLRAALAMAAAPDA